MNTHRINPVFLFLAILAVYIASWQLQSQLLLNPDVSWLSLAAAKMLAGGNYINHFFETNPPLIIYLYQPLVLLDKFLGISVIYGIRIYIFLLASVSLLLCAHLVKPIFRAEDDYLRSYTLFLLSLLFLILPVNDFGQREHLSVILTMPYLLLMVNRLQNNQSWGLVLPSFIGLMAGIGFCTKPYFLLPFALIEIYHLYRKPHWRSIFRPETLGLGFFVLGYLSLIYFRHQDYVQQIVPLVTQFYYQRYQRGILRMLRNEESIFNYFVLGFYCLRYRQFNYPDFAKVFILAALGFWLVYLGQRMGWYYHALPFVSLELLLSSVLFLQLAKQEQMSKSEWISSGVLIALMFSYFLIKIPYISLSAGFYPLAFFSYFFMIFFTLLYLYAGLQIQRRMILSLALIFAINTVFYKCVHVNIFHNYLFLLSTSLLLLCFFLFFPSPTASIKGRYLLLSVLGLLLFALPTYKMAYVFDYATYYKMLYSQLTDTMKRFASKKVIYLSNASEMAFPSMSYCGQNYVTRFWSLMWLPEMAHPYDVKTYPAYYAANKQQLDFYMSALLADFKQNKPDYVFVDVRQRGHYYYTPPPDYLSLFGLREDFREEWGKYRYLYTLDSRPLYRLEVYQRG